MEETFKILFYVRIFLAVIGLNLTKFFDVYFLQILKLLTVVFLYKFLIVFAYFQLDFDVIDVTLDSELQVSNVIWDILDWVFQGNDFMRLVFSFVINAMHTQNFVLSLTIKTEIIIMLETSLVSYLRLKDAINFKISL